VPLTEVFDRIYQHHGTSLAVTSKSDDRDLTAFMEAIIPDYDRQRVYMSDIRKLITWYGAVSNRLEYQSAEAAAGDEAAAQAEETDPTTNTLSTAGAITDQTPEPNEAAGNPEADGGKQKKSKKTAE
jgi:hypothetical protein